MAKYQVTNGSHEGTSWVVWGEYLSGTSGPMKARATYQGKSDASMSAPFDLCDMSGTPLTIADMGMSNVSKGGDAQQRHIFTPIINGETDQSNWFSCNNMRKWERV